MSSNEQDRLSAALAELPRAQAPPGFTERLVARLDVRGRRRRGRWVLATAAAAAAGALILLLSTERPPRQPSSDGLTARAAQLRQEQLELRRELEALRSLADETAPVIYVASEPDFDVVLDLGPYLADRPRGVDARPAAYPASTPPEPRRQ